MSEITLCPSCGAKNRLGQPPPDQVPSCGRCGQSLPWLLPATDADFDRALEAPTPVLVDLWAPWCGPCLALAPVLDDVARDLAGRLKVLKVDVDQNPRTAARFQVQSIPMMVVFEAGRQVLTLRGLQSRRDLKSKLAPYLSRS